MKRAISLALLTMALLSASACNTMQGIGKDVGAAGSTLEDAAKKNRTY